MSKSEMTDDAFEKLADVLVREYVSIIKKGFPEKETARWEARVDKLPPIARDSILMLVEMSDTLKSALTDREHKHNRGR